MKPRLNSSIVNTMAAIVAAVLLIFAAGKPIPFVDTHADTYFNTAITKAGVAYATCRVVNATVSVIKESHIELEPAGIGVSLAAGQVLDPIDDMTERLSDVIVTAVTSLGVQKLAHEILVSLSPPILALLVLMVAILHKLGWPPLAVLRQSFLKMAVIVLVARICLPFSSVANNLIYNHFFEERIAAANAQLSIVSQELDRLKTFTIPEVDGLIGTIEKSAALLKRKAEDLNMAMQTIADHMGELINTLLHLTFIFVALFLIQVILLPLLMFWFLAKIFGTVFQPQPRVVVHPDQPKLGTTP